MELKWISSTEHHYFEEKENIEITEETPNLVLTNEKKRIIEGFGGCFNELGWLALKQLPVNERDLVLDDLFSLEGECQFTICRLPIGASDYATSWYSHDEVDEDYELKHFNIERDKLCLIPYIKEALKRNPNLKLFASPWSPPTWMKYPKAYNYGSLRWEKRVLEAYALYFVKFIEAYKEEGITIHQIHVQNEVVADQKFPSCVWNGEQLREFIGQYLGPAFDKYKIDTEIWLGTINAPEPYDELRKGNKTDFNHYANTVLSDPQCYQYVKGVGYQWAGKYAIQQTVMSYPELRYMQTENECGNGRNSYDYAQYIFQLFRHYFINGANAYIYWNMVLEPEGKSTWGWSQNSMVTINPQTKEVIKNPEFYVMKHFSHYVLPRAKRLETTGVWTGNAVTFLNQDGSKVVIVMNPFNETRELRLKESDVTFKMMLEPNSFNTVIIK